ncbi:MAG: hypothetical protein JOZ54_12975 [Acidobacteria bacterium]|nr:hypothetical protein [Acidobacteriota bacterium]
MYAAELLVFPLPLSVLASVVGLASGSSAALALPPAVAAVRIAQVAMLSRATGARIRLRGLACVPVLDLLQFGAQFVPYFNNKVTWRGHTARIGRKTVMRSEAA